jgi:gamma-glutamyltranspeptidase
VDARDNTTKENYPNFVTEVIDCREVAPEESTEDMYSGLPNSASMVGGLAVAVPGEVSS